MVKAPLGLDTTSSGSNGFAGTARRALNSGPKLGKFKRNWARQCLENNFRPAQPLIKSLANISRFRTLEVWQILGTPREGSAPSSTAKVTSWRHVLTLSS